MHCCACIIQQSQHSHRGRQSLRTELCFIACLAGVVFRCWRCHPHRHCQGLGGRRCRQNGTPLLLKPISYCNNHNIMWVAHVSCYTMLPAGLILWCGLCYSHRHRQGSGGSDSGARQSAATQPRNHRRTNTGTSLMWLRPHVADVMGG